MLKEILLGRINLKISSKGETVGTLKLRGKKILLELENPLAFLFLLRDPILFLRIYKNFRKKGYSFELKYKVIKLGLPYRF